MLIRCLILLFLFPLPALANCLDPVVGQYIVVTSNPSILTSNKSLQKTSNLNFIYNHQNQVLQKTSSNKKNLVSLEVSTLVLNLDAKTASALKKHPEVLSLENDCYISTSDEEASETLVINDSLFASEQQWLFDLANIKSKLPTSTHSTLVAVSDTGFEYNHPDLNENIWLNTPEIDGHIGIDDDKNNCIDDIYGCDVTLGNGSVGPNLYAANLVDHGTHVAGIIAAKQNNNRGIYGVASNSKLMLVKGFSSHRKTSASDLLKSVYYSVDNGAEIINCSWGISANPTLAEFSAFEYARQNNVLAVVAAGNQSIFASKSSPSGLTNVLVVGSTNSKKEISTFSNFGESVDIYAPGGDGKDRLNEFIFSLLTNNLYGGKRGTSMAAPFITGLLANVKSAYPQATRHELLNLLLISADEIPVYAYYDKKYTDTAKFINAENLYALAEQYFSSGVRNLDVEAKEIRRPTSIGVIPTADAALDGASSGNGCMSATTNHSSNSARIPVSVILILLPIAFLFFMRAKYKNTPR